jgi:hypothetical protein
MMFFKRRYICSVSSFEGINFCLQQINIETKEDCKLESALFSDSITFFHSSTFVGDSQQENLHCFFDIDFRI